MLTFAMRNLLVISLPVLPQWASHLWKRKHVKLPSIGSIGMRNRLVTLLAFAMLPLAATVTLYLWVDHRQTIDTARNSVYAAANLAASTETRIFDETRALLETLALTPTITPAGGDACSSFVARVKNANPIYNTVGVVDANGTITCHNSLRARQNLSDATLVDKLKASGGPNFLIGNFVIGRVSGKPTVIVASKFPPVGGKFSGAVFASLNLDRMTRDVEIFSDTGMRSVILLEPASKRVIIHYPPLPGVPFGTPFPNAPLIKAINGSTGGGTAKVRGIDGVERIYGFASLPSAGNIVLAVGEDWEAMVAPVRYRLFLSAAGLLTLLLAAASFVWWLSERTQLRPIRKLMAAATQIGAGNFDATAGLEAWQAPEFRKLGRILESMAVKLADGRKAEAIVAANESRFRVLAENSADLITCSDGNGRRIYVSPACRDILGYEPEELIGLAPRDLAHPDDVGIVDAMMSEVQAGRAVSGVRYRVAHRGGGYRWAEIAGKPLAERAGTVFVMRDFTSRKLIENQLAEANIQLERLASTDGLTGLANRRALDKQLETEFARAMRGKADLSFLLIDVDHFKAFNDHYGHQAGDDCLRRLASTLQGCLRRPGDVTARYGGEELAAILPATGAAGAIERAEVVCRAVRELAIPHPGSSHGIVTISVGVATLTAKAEWPDVAALVKAADKALYVAKAGGRDKVVASTS
jgi:diguanylate cyclase (GGDEF)-like protein/PAS domain S-box-containing protein